MHINIGENIERFMKQSYGFQRRVHEQFFFQLKTHTSHTRCTRFQLKYCSTASTREVSTSLVQVFTYIREHLGYFLVCN